MKTVMIFLIILHVLIHLLGFAKSINPANIIQLSQNIPRVNGILWLISAILFVAVGILFFSEKNWWWLPAIIAVLVSQFLIISNWHDAKFGTVVNAVILFAIIIGYATWNFRRKYEQEVKTGLNNTLSIQDSLLTETDIKGLPTLVQKYIRYTGAIDQPKVKNFKVEFSGRIRKDKKSDWMPFTSEQYNFLAASTRLFFMNATMKHIQVTGLHSFKNGTAFMDIRLLSLFIVQYQMGKEMGIAETVTFFNDMCCLAPATLIDKRINWHAGNGNCVKATFKNNGITISATLYFDETGALINFISDDRYAVTAENILKKLRWSTPLRNYKNINGHKLPGDADVIYSYPEGDLCYGNFKIINVRYNCKTLDYENK